MHQITAERKECRVCKQPRLLKDYPVRATAPDGKDSQCIFCKAEIAAIYRKRYKDKLAKGGYAY